MQCLGFAALSSTESRGCSMHPNCDRTQSDLQNNMQYEVHCTALEKAETPIKDLFILFLWIKSTDKSVCLLTKTTISYQLGFSQLWLSIDPSIECIEPSYLDCFPFFSIVFIVFLYFFNDGYFCIGNTVAWQVKMLSCGLGWEDTFYTTNMFRKSLLSGRNDCPMYLALHISLLHSI